MKIKNMKQIFTFFSLLATVFLLHAQDYTENNVTYIITDATNHYAMVVGNGNAGGDIIIRSTVTINGTNYSVTAIDDSAFSGMSELKSIIIPNSVTFIGNWAFNGCSGLTSINIPNSVTTIGVNAFSGCTELTSINLPNSITSIDFGTFSACSKLTSVTIPNSVTSIGDFAFANCESLTSLTIPNSVTSIESSAFAACTGLTSISIPNSITSIAAATFSDCYNLTSVTIPNSVTFIDSFAFNNCTSLTSLTIPSSVTTINGYAFMNCTSLATINCYSPNPIGIEDTVFDGVNQSTCVLNVPSGSVSTYQSTYPWHNFNNINSLGTLNTSNVQSANNLKIYPNPATDFVMVQNAKNIKISKVNITDTNGRIVSTLNHLENGKIDVTKLPKGMYIISIFSEKGTENFKLMKK